MRPWSQNMQRGSNTEQSRARVCRIIEFLEPEQNARKKGKIRGQMQDI